MAFPCSNDILGVVAGFLTPKELGKLSMVCKSASDTALGPRCDHIWKLWCAENGFKQTGSRGRGVKPWYSVYKAGLCVSCFEPGRKLIDVNTGSVRNEKMAPLCNSCFYQVSASSTAAERNACLIAMKKDMRKDILRSRIFTKIPYAKKKKK